MPRRSLDAAWKDALRLFFLPFLEFFRPDLYEYYDHTRTYQILEQELRRIQRRARVGKKVVDLLVELPLKGGGEVWLLVHLEVQSQRDDEFPLRMWIYNYRAYDLYRRPVLSMAILADPSPNWRPNRHESKVFGCTTTFEFPIFKLLDWIPKLEELEASTNPFALVVAFHLRAHQHPPESPSRLYCKRALYRRLFELGLSKDEIDGLFMVMDTILSLSRELEEQFEQTVAELEDSMELTLPKIYAEKVRQEERKRMKQKLQLAEERAARKLERTERALQQERERAQQERERAEQLAARLRALGIDPET